MTLLLVYLGIALLVSFLCSILEAVLLSITPSYVASLEASGDPTGPALKAMKDDIDKPLAAILSFNTIAHTVGAAGVGAQASKVFGDAYLGVTSGVLTLLILIFSEIIPKTIGALYWRSLTGFSARTLKILIFLMYPLVLLSKVITKIIAGNKKTEGVSREEVSAMAQLGEQSGVFQKSESRMLQSMIQLAEVTAKDVMTPRTVVVMASGAMTVTHWYEKDRLKIFSRIPIYRDNRDDIQGYVHKTELLTALAEGKGSEQLQTFVREITRVPENEALPALMDDLLQTKEHLALVTDNFGGVSGLVTLEDIIETMVGVEIMDEFDDYPDMRQYARDHWKKRAEKYGIPKDNASEEPNES